MARQTKFSASKAVTHFFKHTTIKLVTMIDDRAKEKSYAYGPTVRVNANTLKRKPIHA